MEKRGHELASVPYFVGLMAGEPDALVESFAGEPQLHQPVRGRIKGVRAFRAFVAETNEWLAQRKPPSSGGAPGLVICLFFRQLAIGGPAPTALDAVAISPRSAFSAAT